MIFATGAFIMLSASIGVARVERSETRVVDRAATATPGFAARAFQVNADAGAFAGLAFGLHGALAALAFPVVYWLACHWLG